MIGVTAKAELREVENGLRRMQLAGHNLKPVFRAVRRAVRLDMREHAREQRSSEGAWPRLASGTLSNRRARSGKQGRKRKRPPRRMVRPLGRLPMAFDIQYTASSIKAISRVKWSGAHQGQHGGVLVGHGARIPEREWLWASSKLLSLISRKAVDYMAGAFEDRNRL